jgi:hypothetical protein
LTAAGRCLPLLVLSWTAAEAKPYLRWHFEAGARSGADRICHAASVAWIEDSGAPRWSRELPPRVRWAGRMACGSDSYDPKRGPPPATDLFNVLETKRAVVIGDATGILALAKKDGAVLLDWKIPRRQGRPFLFLDSGTFRIGRCKKPLRDGRFFERCRGRFVYFNRADAALVRRSDLSVTATGALSRVKSLGRMRFSAKVRIGRQALHIEGMVYE